MSDSEELKRIARQFFEEVWNQGSPTALDDLMHPDAVAYESGHPVPLHGIEEMRMHIKQYRQAFPDIHFTPEDQLAEGDKVLSRWRTRGTHRGTLRGIPATNRAFEVTGMTVDQIQDGKIIASWVNWDTLGLLQQIGIVPQRSRRSALLIAVLIYVQRAIAFVRRLVERVRT